MRPYASAMADRQPAERRSLGAWYTPPPLVDRMVDALVAGLGSQHGQMKLLDPACGDARLLTAVCDRLGPDVHAIGADIDAGAVSAVHDDRLSVRCADGIAVDWAAEGGPFDLVIANPPFLSQMATSTSRGGASRLGGGPYANTAMEFCLAGVRALRPGGRMVILLPQSVLTARDAAALRASVTSSAQIVDSWWSPERPFDADVNVCMLVLERRPNDIEGSPAPWSSVVTSVLGIPDLPSILTRGVLGDRARATANFRDEYYALVPAVADDTTGPPLVTAGLIDVGVCCWGTRSVRFAKQRFDHPRVNLDRLEGRFRSWAEGLLVPKVLVAAQTAVVEAVVDPAGEWLPGIPVISVVPEDSSLVYEIAAVLTSPVASIAVWHAMAGSGLAPTSVRLSPSLVMALPWPAGDLTAAVTALRGNDVVRCAWEVLNAYGVDGDSCDALVDWWTTTGRLQ